MASGGKSCTAFMTLLMGRSGDMYAVPLSAWRALTRLISFCPAYSSVLAVSTLCACYATLTLQSAPYIYIEFISTDVQEWH